MANRERGEVEVLIKGDTYVLKFDFNSLAKLESRLGATVAKIFQTDRIGLTTIRECLFVGIHWGKKMTSDDVGKLLDLSEIASYAERIAEAVALATGDKKSTDPTPAPAETAIQTGA